MRHGKFGIEAEEYKALLTAEWEGNLRIPLPCCPCELEAVSEYIFGTPLHLRGLHCHGDYASYEVDENFDSYVDKKFAQAVHDSEYDMSGAFWGAVIGELSTGGTARASYGQVKVPGHRQKLRLAKLQRYVRGTAPNKRGEGGCAPRAAFRRLAAQSRERREQIEPV